MSSRIIGVDRVVSRLDGFCDPEKMRQQMKEACLLVESEARELAPKGKHAPAGGLRRSIDSRVEEQGGEYVGVVFTPLEYAPYVEFGTGLFAEVQGRSDVPWCYQDEKGEWHTTSGMEPRPFMRPALNNCRQRVLQILKEGLSND